MKDYAVSLAVSQQGMDQKRNILREYIQSYALSLLQKSGVFQAWAFVGGTALRFLYDLPRFSEDLDFSLEKPFEKDFEDVLKFLKDELNAAGYNVEVSCRVQKTVQSAMVRFSGLLYETGISPLKDQKMSIKIEIDTHPPDGAACVTKLINRYMPISFLSYDIPSLFSGKIHALLSRPYTKGRDFYDVCWYVSKFKDLTPNMIFLCNALKQTGWERDLPTARDWKNYVADAVEQVDWAVISKDVTPFLERSGDMDVFTKEQILIMLKG
ncbi:MAG TPA: nucleotidyl transferase AbiEii/AbiGii toxin family protein [Candidatus Omnitrophota bacterium]|nr:nucleotidyl transferase AbiEii/AbiGii toxin family protein [Candidatus Omnitrophota bacterium]